MCFREFEKGQANIQSGEENRQYISHKPSEPLGLSPSGYFLCAFLQLPVAKITVCIWWCPAFPLIESTASVLLVRIWEQIFFSSTLAFIRCKAMSSETTRLVAKCPDDVVGLFEFEAQVGCITMGKIPCPLLALFPCCQTRVVVPTSWGCPED